MLPPGRATLATRPSLTGSSPWAKTIGTTDVAAFAASYAIMGAQRATKILGIFARLDRRDGKPQYLAHLPRIERSLAKSLAHPLLSAIKVWHQTHLPQALGASA